jgi:hypothetical protein
MVCSHGGCVAEAKPGRQFCTVHDAHYRKVEAADVAAGRICGRCRRKLGKGDWIQADGEALVHARPCQEFAAPVTESEL